MNQNSYSIDSHLVNKMNRVLQRHLEVVLEVSPRVKRPEVTGAATLHDGKDSDAGVVVQKRKNTSDYVVDFNSEHLPNWGKEQTLTLKDLLWNQIPFADCSLRMAGNLTVRSLLDGSIALQAPAWELEYKVELTKKPTTCHVVLVSNQYERGQLFLYNYWKGTGEYRGAYNFAALGYPASAFIVERSLKEDKTCLKRLSLS